MHNAHVHPPCTELIVRGSMRGRPDYQSEWTIQTPLICHRIDGLAVIRWDWPVGSRVFFSYKTIKLVGHRSKR